MKSNLRYSLQGAALFLAIMGALVLGYHPTPRHVADTVPLHPAVATESEKKSLALSTEQRTAAINGYNKLPLSFEENKGQADPTAKYLARGNGYSLYLKPNEAMLSLRNNDAQSNSFLRMKLANANAASTISGVQMLPGKSNYFVGNKAHYATDISQYKKVLCENVYAGIDLVYYGNQRQLEYDFVVAPGADPSAIRMSFAGSNKIEVDAAGNLAIHLGDSEIMQHKPVIYQLVDGARKEVAGHYEIVSAGKTAQDETVVGFSIANYDRSAKLVIDPVLVYATFYGDKPNTTRSRSDHSGDDIGLAIAIDATGAAYVVGKTNSYEFPQMGNIETVFDPIDHGSFPTVTHKAPANYHGFITKFMPDGSQIVYSTYLAGSGIDICRGVLVDALGNAFICGSTTSSDFPTKFAQHVYSGGQDAFLLKLNANANDFIFSTFLGGSGDDIANDLAIDSTGNVIVVGTTSSPNFITAHPLQAAYGGGNTDAFVAKFSSDGQINVYCTFLGGAGDDTCNGVATDASGNAYVTGSTTSLNFPIAGPFQVNKGGGSDAFVSKINSTGTLLVYSTYIGGNGDDVGNGIAVDTTGSVYITGSTASTDFPTISPTILPIQTANGGPPGTTDAFVTKFNVFGSSLIFSTYLGGTMNEVGKRVRIDSRNAIYVTGTTHLTAGALASQNDFPVAPKATPNNPSANTLQPSHSGNEDAFLTKFNPTGTPLVYSTFVGSGTHVFTTDNGSRQVTDINGSNFLYNFLRAGPITAGSEAGNAVTITTSSAHGLAVGDRVAVSGVVPAGYNGTFTVTATPTPLTFQYTNTVAGLAAGSSFGTIMPSGTFKTATKYNPPGGTPNVYLDNTNTLVYSAIQFDSQNPNNPTYPGTPLSPDFDWPTRVSVNGMAVDNFGNAYLTGSTDGSFYYTFGAYSDIAPNFPVPGEDFPAPHIIEIIDPVTGAILPEPAEAGLDVDEYDVIITKIGDSSPIINSAMSAQATNGLSFNNYTIKATNNPLSFDAAGLPPGLSVSTVSGQISGIPTQDGVYNVVITASNQSGTGSQILIISVSSAKPNMTSATSATASVGSVFQFQLTADNNPGSFALAPVSPTVSIPGGITLDAITGLLSGIPLVEGTYQFNATASNANGTSLPQSFSLTVLPAIPVISSPVDVQALLNVPFSYAITATGNPQSYGATPNLGPVPPIANSALSESGSTATVTTSVAHNLTVGQSITIAGVVPGGYNGIYTVTSVPTATTFTYTAASIALAPATTAGTFAPNIILLPIGLQLNTVTGFITGTPTSLGFYKFIVSATNAGGTGTQQFNLTVVPALVPVISSSNVATGICNEPFSFTITASNNPLVFGVIGALPAGLTLDDQTGIISGVITDGVTGVFNLTQTAANVAGPGTKPLQITVNAPAKPVIISPLTASAVVNAPFEYDILGTNHPTSYNAVGLPAGLAINTVTGAITGTPTAFGNFSVTIQATNFGGTGSANLALNVAQQQTPIIVSPNQANGFVGIPFSYQIVATANPMSFSTSGNPLPPGLSINATGLISGTPTTAGTYTPTIKATNPIGTGSKTLTIFISTPVAPTFTSPLSVNGIDGSPFNYRITATGIGPIVFTAIGLPPGLTLDPVTGTISGTAVSGTTNVTLTAFSPATNPATPGGAATLGVPPTTATLQINISPSPAAIVNNPAPPVGTVGQPYLYNIQASGSAPLTLSTSALPAGLTLVGSTIQGTPTSAAVTVNGPFPVTITASNTIPSSASITVYITINAAKPSFTSSAFALGIDGAPFRYVIAATGTQTITYTSTTLPPGLTLVGNIISGRPTSAAIGTTNVTITATNKGGSATLDLLIEIDPAAPVLTIPASVTGSAGVPFAFTLTATGSPQINYVVSNLPAGLMVDIDQIDGTPTTPGIYNVIVSATNDGGTDNKPLTIIINPSPPIITAAQISGFDGKPLTAFKLVVTGGQPITFSAVNLPAGITIDVNTGIISGTPIGFGSSSATVTATNAGGSGTQTIVFNISPSKPTITSLLQVQASLGVPFSYTIVAIGSPTISYQVFFPNGTTTDHGLTASGSVISGTPNQNGTLTVTLVATNQYGNDTQTLDIVIAQFPPVITNSTLNASGQQFVAFSYTIAATGSPPITFTAAPLPNGLTLDANTGVISGAPTVTGTFNVAITATNPFGTDTGKTLVITIANSPPKITSALSVQGGLSAPFTYTITAVGSPTIIFGVQNSSLPAGLVLNQSTGVISGTPTAVGTFPITIVATNTAGFDSKTLTITVTATPPVITSPLTISTGIIQNITYVITVTGAGPLTYSATGLPPGLTFSGNTITGTASTPGVYNVILTVTNPLGTDTETLVITVSSDADGDGFPDDLEVFLGTDPNSPASNPFTGGVGTITVLNITSESVKLNFAKPGTDTITLKGSLLLAPGFDPLAKPAVIYVSGIAAKVTINAKTTSSLPGLKVKNPSKTLAGGFTTFSATLGKGNFQAKLAAVGMTNENVLLPRSVSTMVIVFFNNTIYTSNKALTYKAHFGKNGTAKQSN